ncbi:hypothetical protein CTI12_AA428450 [Artemisia annua]|uniref:Uncharacterized protein n=1 Tax=Artemisia annua TaxID=35608 RepID=A0A2U1M263_ARTAN|nr:hypothetical protein CTI12_AA428450 [Artemisia annua]
MLNSVRNGEGLNLVLYFKLSKTYETDASSQFQERFKYKYQYHNKLNSSNYTNISSINAGGSTNSVFPTGASLAGEPASGGVPNRFLGITPGYLCQIQVLRTSLLKDVAEYQMPFLHEIEIHLKSKWANLADAFIDDLGQSLSLSPSLLFASIVPQTVICIPYGRHPKNVIVLACDAFGLPSSMALQLWYTLMDWKTKPFIAFNNFSREHKLEMENGDDIEVMLHQTRGTVKF